MKKLIVLVCLIGGCIAHVKVKLTKAGQRIRIVNSISASDKCDFIDEIEVHKQLPFLAAATHSIARASAQTPTMRRSLRIQLRNEAAKLKGTHLQLGRVGLMMGSFAQQGGTVYRCEP